MDNEKDTTEYNDSDWHTLKLAVLGASNTKSNGKYELFDDLPEHLRASEVGDLIYQAVYLGHKKAASKAAAILTDGADNAYLILAKS